VIVSWVDEDGQEHRREIPAWIADAAGRVFADDLGRRRVRVGGRRPGGRAEEYHRHLFAQWEAGQHTRDAGDVEAG